MNCRKYLLTVLLIVISTITLPAQILSKFYYNSNWELTKKDSAVYIRVCLYDTALGYFTGPITDLYKDGRPQMRGKIVAVQKMDILPDGKATNVILLKASSSEKINAAVLKAAKSAIREITFPTKLQDGSTLTQLNIPFKFTKRPIGDSADSD